MRQCDVSVFLSIAQVPKRTVLILEFLKIVCTLSKSKPETGPGKEFIGSEKKKVTAMGSTHIPY